MSVKNISLYPYKFDDNKGNRRTKPDKPDKPAYLITNLKKKQLDTKKDYDEEIISVNGLNCIGPCYPPDTIYYNPLNLVPIRVPSLPSCPTKKYEVDIEGETNTLYYDICHPEDINKGYLTFDVFNDVVQIANTPNNFLKQIYSISNISDLVHFLSNSFDTLPIYSQRRLGKVIFEVYWKYVEFPKSLFIKKLINILIRIYKIDISKLSDEKKIIKELDRINENSLDMYNYLLEKFS